MISIDLLWTKITQFGEIGLAGLSAIDYSTPPKKIKMEPKNGGLEDVFPFPRCYFQVPYSFPGVYSSCLTPPSILS